MPSKINHEYYEKMKKLFKLYDMGGVPGMYRSGVEFLKRNLRLPFLSSTSGEDVAVSVKEGMERISPSSDGNQSIQDPIPVESQAITSEVIRDLKTVIAETPIASVRSILGELGYVPKPATGEAILAWDIEKIKEEAKKQGRESALKDILTILDICTLGNADPQAASGFIRDGLGPEKARENVLKALATEAQKSQIRSTVSPLSTGEINPLVQDARKRRMVSENDDQH